MEEATEATPTTVTTETQTAAAAAGEAMRGRIGQLVFREQVREGLEDALKKKVGKRGVGFGASAVPKIVAAVPDDEIDRTRADVEAENRAEATEGGGTGAGKVGGPIIDWLKDPTHRAIVKQVIERLLALLV
jgi:hypothetical protein